MTLFYLYYKTNSRFGDMAWWPRAQSLQFTAQHGPHGSRHRTEIIAVVAPALILASLVIFKSLLPVLVILLPQIFILEDFICSIYF